MPIIAMTFSYTAGLLQFPGGTKVAAEGVTILHVRARAEHRAEFQENIVTWRSLSRFDTRTPINYDNTG